VLVVFWGLLITAIAFAVQEFNWPWS